MADEVPNPAGASSPPPPPIFGDPKPAVPPTTNPNPQAVTTPPAEPVTPPAEPAKATTNPAEPPKEPERIVPEKYDLKLPSDTVLDQQALARLESYARTQKLTQEEAAELVTRNDENVRHALEERKTAWLKETQADREIGGENLSKNVETANRFLDKYMAPELRSELTRTGYGNNRHFMKFVLDMAQRSNNDQLVTGGQVSAATPKSTAEMLYGNTMSKRN